MIEVEFKFQVPKKDFVKAMSKLILSNEVQEKRIFIDDLYFQHPSKNFKDTDEALRLRKIEDKAIITYKGPKLSKISKTREELEMSVEDYNKAEDILVKLGFKPLLHVKKERTTFIPRYGMKISFDIVEGLGTFIEAEMEIDDPDRIKTYEKKILDYIYNTLGIKNAKSIRKSYLELLLEKD